LLGQTPGALKRLSPSGDKKAIFPLKNREKTPTSFSKLLIFGCFSSVARWLR
jgi:hypothetical protein